MQFNKFFFTIAAIFFLSSCALFGIRSGAQYEFEQGLALFNRGQYQEAIPHFERATELDPEFAKAHLYLGRSYLNLGRWLEALSPLRAAFRLSPAETKQEIVHILIDALFGSAIYEFKKGNFQTSIGFLREILELEPQSEKAKNELVSTLVVFGGELLSEGKVTEAIDTFSEALEFSPNDMGAYLGLARSFFKNGNLLKALQAIKKALNIDPTNEEARHLFRDLLRQ